MNNYQSQQLFNNINSIIGFTTSIIFLGLVVGMVRPMGKFFEPPLRPEKHLPRPVVKEVTVPGGSYWKCVSCGKELPPGTKVFKAGKEVYCSIPCIKLPEHHSVETGYRSGALRVTKGMMASEGEGLYIAKTKKLAAFFIEPGVGVREVKFKTPKNLLVAEGRYFSLTGDEDILKPISNLDTEWERYQKQAARNTGITLDDWLEDPKDKLPSLNAELSRLIGEAGYDAIDAGGWYVLLDEALWKDIQ